ncbi:MAG TPA: YciI family protein [Mycobacteriales bacterium]|jgi:hypothetical protein|nr:YciI family protein [Mycobacteriales bacterium]
MRVLTLLKMGEQVGEAPAELYPAMDAVIKEIDASLKLIDTNGLVPSATAGARIRTTAGRTTILDGPFAETRELVGGYAIVEVDTFAEAVEAARKIVQVHADHWPSWEGEAEVRQIEG